MKSLQFYENYLTLFCQEKKQTLHIHSEQRMAKYPGDWNNYLA
jgi:hypothetical protein